MTIIVSAYTSQLYYYKNMEVGNYYVVHMFTGIILSVLSVIIAPAIQSESIIVVIQKGDIGTMPMQIRSQVWAQTPCLCKVAHQPAACMQSGTETQVRGQITWQKCSTSILASCQHDCMRLCLVSGPSPRL